MFQSRFLRNLRLGLENVLLHKLRSLLTMLGIVFGVGSVIAMLSVGEGASRQAMDQISRLGSHNIIISSEKPLADKSASASGRKRSLLYGLTYADHHRIRETFDTVKTTVPAKILRKEASVGPRRTDVRLVGTTAAWFELVERDVVAGRTLMPEDVTECNAVAVVTEAVAHKLLAVEHVLGQSLRVGSDVFEVVGVVRNRGGEGTSIQSPDRTSDIYIPLPVARERYGDTEVRIASGSYSREDVQLHQIIVRIDSLKHVEPTAEAIERMFQSSHKTKDYQFHVPLALLRQAQATKRTFNIVLGSIACISLIVGGIGIMNIMLASVTERTREIGVRRALGAKKRQIVHQFLVETVVLSTSGGIIGVALGLLIPVAITYLTQMPTQVTSWSVGLSLFISIAIGITFGIYPAVRAANLDPIEALRHE
ncbi:MAG: ABC transporter permease [Verrucomicrobia bacterium]|nr:ABC transporter permease [Verrucomicrobiota bacterium]